MDKNEIYTVMARHCEPAIMLHRPYPLTSAHKGRSYLGGTPSLPRSLEWPRTRAGIPLHFLAQIDCSELPSSNGVLPENGVLFFFARIDDEVVWEDETHFDDCRVLFTANAEEAPVPAPSDLPSLEGGYSNFEENFMLPGDPVYSTYPKWPVDFLAIDSWPDASALPNYHDDENPLSEYKKAVNHARSAEADRATGLPPALKETEYVTICQLLGILSPRNDSERRSLPYEGRVFPQLWIMVDRVARCLANWAGEWLSRDSAERYNLVVEFQTIQRDAIRWVETATTAGLNEQPFLEQRLAFKDWLIALSEHESIHVSNNAYNQVARGMASALQYVAMRPDLLPTVPSSYLDAVAGKLMPNYSFSDGPNRISHQMLGNAKSAQQANPVDREEVLLLQLISDPGVNFMFCDMGEAEFWISKDDLANRQFDRVRATTCGG